MIVFLLVCPHSLTPLRAVVIQSSINFIWSSHWFNSSAPSLPMNTDFYLRCRHCFCLLGLSLTECIVIQWRITLILVNCHCLWHPFCEPTFVRVVLILRRQARAKTGQNSRSFFFFFYTRTFTLKLKVKWCHRGILSPPVFRQVYF